MTAKLGAEDVAYWYLRLNGFLCLRNFLVHGDRGGDDRTEIDVVGVRFRYRREHLNRPMIDDDWIERDGRTIVVFCDAKQGAQGFNPAWRSDRRRVMESFLALVGILPEQSWDHAARNLYATGRSETPGLLLTALLINHDPQRLVSLQWEDAQVVQLTEALRFIHRRFTEYDLIKRSHAQWDCYGHALWSLYRKNYRAEEEFVKAGLEYIGSA